MHWRTGRKNARNIYFVSATGDEFHVGVMFTEALGRYTVEYLNQRDATQPPLPDGEIGEPARPES